MEPHKKSMADAGLGPDQVVPAVFFRERTGRLENERTQIDRRIARVANGRLLSFLAGAGCALGFGLGRHPVPAWLGGVLFFALFLTLVFIHDRLYRKRKWTDALCAINRTAWKRLTDCWQDVGDDGRQFVDAAHPCSGDLDLFGPGSLYQWCSTAETPVGRKALAELLSDPCRNPASIRRRQEAVRELAGKLSWRQDLQAEARLAGGAFCEAADLARWANESVTSVPQGMAGTFVRIAAWGLPAFTMTLAALTAFVPGMPVAPLLTGVLAEMLLLAWRWRSRNAALASVEKAAADMRVHHRLLERFEALPTQAKLLDEMKDRLKDGHGRTASAQTRRLARIVDGLGNRRHQLYVLVNILFQLDWHFLFAVEAWRRESGMHLSEWVAVNGELEALCSLASIRHAHPDWAMPDVADPMELRARRPSDATRAGVAAAGTSAAGGPEDADGHACRFLAQSVGHPLLKAPCVTNSVTWATGETIRLITGSNMSGKSTLLRTIGVNLVLAMAGAPVYAEAFRFTPCRLFTCMRIRDDIEQGVSSFYAELLRIRSLIGAVGDGERVFFFLDEIFKGTNSADRHAGAEALVRWLVGQDSPERQVIGLISTHDLELGQLEETCPGVRNAHFQEHYADGELRFDYLLRTGVSTTRNALWLMRLAGLPMADDAGIVQPGPG